MLLQELDPGQQAIHTLTPLIEADPENPELYYDLGVLYGGAGQEDEALAWMRRALELLAEEANPIPLEQAKAREDIWTPEKEREEKGELWTPGSD